MKLSLNLLEKFINLSKYTPEELADLLTDRSFEIEEIQKVEPEFTNVITAKVIKIEKHPNADRLRIITLNDGQKKIGPVICGAFNFKESDIVALALPGALIPSNIHSNSHESFTLEKTAIRGIISQGMICAKFELGLSQEKEEGIWVLPKMTKLGEDIKNLVPSDTRLEISIPANRPDLHSHLGVAREFSAITGIKFKEPQIPIIKNIPGQYKFNAKKELTNQFISIVIEGLTIKDSPDYIKSSLLTCGIRPINNVVDITNYVMIALGQPSHAFDKDKIKGGITVRNAFENEKIKLINHKEYRLKEFMSVLADEKGALDVAGIMGGIDSEVSDNTTGIILTINAFNPTMVRQTSSYLGLKSEAGRAFEKGLHKNLGLIAAQFSMDLFKKYTGGKVKQITIINNAPREKQQVINFKAEQISKLLGTSISEKEAQRSLAKYGIKVIGNKNMKASIPWYRADIKEVPDLSDEILKARGLNSIKPVPFANYIDQTHYSKLPQFIYDSKLIMANLGFNEVQNYSFISGRDIQNYRKNEKHIKVSNPLSSEQEFLKKDLLIPLLKNISDNQNSNTKIKLFEIGNAYHGYGDEKLILSAISTEKEQLAENIYTQLKGVLETYLKQINILDYKFQEQGNHLEILKDKITIGNIGLIEPLITNNFDIHSTVCFFNIDLEAVLTLRAEKKYIPLSNFPEALRDISIIISDSVKWKEVEKIALENSLVEKVRLIESQFINQDSKTTEFHRQLAENGKKNYVIRLILRHPEHTLNESEITGILSEIMLKLKQKLRADIR